MDALTIIVVLFVVAALANLLTSMAQTYFTGWTGERILADLRNTLFRHLQRLSLGFFERNRAGVVISRLTNDVEALDQLVTDGVTSLFQNTLMLVGSAVILFILDWRLALAALAVFPLMALATSFFRRRSSRAYRAVRERLGLVTATLAEDIAGMRVVQSFSREETNQREFRSVNNRYRDSNQETVVLNGLYFPFVDFLSAVATAVVLGFGGWLALEGEVTVGTLFAFLLYLSNFFDPVQQLSQLYNMFLSAVAALDKIMDVMDEEPEILDRAGAEQLPQIDGHVRFETVRFGYGQGPEILHGIDLDVPAGTTVALVGHTGRREVDDREAARPLLRPARGPNHDRRPRPARRNAGEPPAPARDRPAGGLPLRGDRAREHRLRPPRCERRGGRRRGEGRRRRGVHPRARGRLRHRRWPSAAAGSHSASGSSSPSRARSWPTRASSSSTRRRRASTSAPSAASSSACAASSPGGRPSSSRTASRRSGAPT